MPGLQIMRAVAATPDVVALVGELNAELGALYRPEQRHGLALEAIFQPHIRFFTARARDESVGCGGVALLADFAEVKRMYVRPAWRGQGAAEAILARLVTETRNAGLKTLRLETGMHSLAAIRFYRRSGFEPCAVFEPYAAMPSHTIATSVFLERQLFSPHDAHKNENGG